MHRFLIIQYSNESISIEKFSLQAINNLLAAAKHNPENEEALQVAIDVVAASQDETLTNQVIELLLGEVDGEARVRQIFDKNQHLIFFNVFFNCLLLFLGPQICISTVYGKETILGCC